MVQVPSELQIIQVMLRNQSNTVECSRKVAGDGSNCIRIATAVDGLEEHLSEVLGRSQKTIEGLRQAFEDEGTAPVAVIDLDRAVADREVSRLFMTLDGMRSLPEHKFWLQSSRLLLLMNARGCTMTSKPESLVALTIWPFDAYDRGIRSHSCEEKKSTEV